MKQSNKSGQPESDPAPVVPLVEELSAALDPWEACRRFAHLPHLLFLDSAHGDDKLGHYSFVTADPFAWLQARGRRFTLSGSSESRAGNDPLGVLQQCLREWRTTTLPGLPPFQGSGWPVWL